MSRSERDRRVVTSSPDTEGNGQRRGHAIRTLLAVMSLVPTPLLVFISSSNRLYVDNRAQLGYQPAVLLPFAELFFITVAVGAVLYLSARWAPFPYALWTYYLVGPFFLVFRFLHGAAERLPFLSWMTQTPSGASTFLVFLLAAVIGLGWKVRPRAAVTPLAFFGVVLLLGEAWIFLDAFPAPEAEVRSSQLTARTEAADRLPSIYHIVLDGFQTEMFELGLDPGAEDALGGFTYFPRNTAVYHLTEISLASTFGSKRYAYDKGKWAFLDDALNGESSLVHRLNEYGYLTSAYLPAVRETQMRLPKVLVRHEDHARASLNEMNTSAFLKLWSYSQIPRGLRGWLWTESDLLDPDSTDLKRMEEGRFLPYSGPVISALSFSRLMQEEKDLPPRGRYTFIHLLIPHPPNVLREDCSYQESGAKTDMRQQIRCTMRLLLEFLDVLHRLGRFDESLIVVHGDHGEAYRMKNGVLVESRSRSLQALLLIKPIGKRKQDGFAESNLPTSLLDVTPTILECVGVGVSADLEGRSLTEAAPCRTAEKSPGFTDALPLGGQGGRQP